MGEREVIEKFNKMGANVVLKDPVGRKAIERRERWLKDHPIHSRAMGQRTPANPIVTVRRDRKGIEVFVIDTFDNPAASVQVLDVQPKDRHLLLQLKNGNTMSKMLAGHDERHWFVASVPETVKVTTVRAAMEALKPDSVKSRQDRTGERGRNERRQVSYIRQGEWFFIPEQQLDISGMVVHRNEPIQRGTGSKPHFCEELVRRGGSVVMIHNEYAPDGVNEIQARALQRKHGWKGWERRVADPEVWVRGRVRHPDHKTIVLKGWHRVFPNTESKANSFGRTMRFFD